MANGLRPGYGRKFLITHLRQLIKEKGVSARLRLGAIEMLAEIQGFRSKSGKPSEPVPDSPGTAETGPDVSHLLDKLD